MKGSCTTVILKDLILIIIFFLLATLGIEPNPTVHETVVPTFTPYRFIFSGGQRGRSLYLQKNIAKLGGRSHKHYLWLADKLPAARAEKAPPYGAALN